MLLLHAVADVADPVHFDHDHRVIDDHVLPSLVQPQDRIGDALLARLLGERKVEQIAAAIESLRRGICVPYKNRPPTKGWRSVFLFLLLLLLLPLHH